MRQFLLTLVFAAALFAGGAPVAAAEPVGGLEALVDTLENDERRAVLLRDLLELGAQLSERIATMTDPREIAALLETEHRRILAALAVSLRATGKSSAAEERARATAEVIPLHDRRPT